MKEIQNLKYKYLYVSSSSNKNIERGFVLTVVLILAVAMFAGTLTSSKNSNDLSGMQTSGGACEANMFHGTCDETGQTGKKSSKNAIDAKNKAKKACDKCLDEMIIATNAQDKCIPTDRCEVVNTDVQGDICRVRSCTNYAKDSICVYKVYLGVVMSDGRCFPRRSLVGGQDLPKKGWVCNAGAELKVVPICKEKETTSMYIRQNTETFNRQQQN